MKNVGIVLLLFCTTLFGLGNSQVWTTNGSGQRAWQGPIGSPYLSTMVGDSGSGGTAGIVPAPGAGTAALGQYLSAAGTFSVPGGNVNSRYYGATATITGTYSAITYSTKDFDSYNGYSGSGYTVPVAGKYLITAGLEVGITTSGLCAVSIGLFKGSSQVSEDYIQLLSSIAAVRAKVTDIVSLSISDVVTVKILSSCSAPVVNANNYQNYFSLAKVGN